MVGLQPGHFPFAHYAANTLQLLPFQPSHVVGNFNFLWAFPCIGVWGGGGGQPEAIESKTIAFKIIPTSCKAPCATREGCILSLLIPSGLTLRPSRDVTANGHYGASHGCCYHNGLHRQIASLP